MITIECLKNGQLRIEFETDREYNSFERIFTQREQNRRYLYHLKKWTVADEDVAYLKRDSRLKDKCLYVFKGLLSTLKYVLTANGMPYKVVGEKTDDKGIEITQRWLDIFASHPKKDMGYDQVQLQTAALLKEKSSGIVSLAVGYGKATIISALVESYLQQHDKDVVLISFTKNLLKELELRLKQYDVDTSRVKLIHPTGFVKSAATKPERWDELSNVGLLIADEAHHASADTWKQVIKACNPDFLYGFTGSADAKSGHEVTPDLVLRKQLTQQNFAMLEYFGESLIHVKLQVPINLISYNAEIISKAEYDEVVAENLNKDIPTPQFIGACTLKHPDFPLTLARIIGDMPDGIVFIPETTSIETGKFICNTLNLMGIRSVFLSAQVQLSPVGEVSMTLEQLKSLAAQKAFRVLIANQVGTEGLDIPNVNSVIPITSVSFKGLVQPVGRAARTTELTCALLYDKHNGVMNRQMKHKLQMLKDHFILKTQQTKDI